MTQPVHVALNAHLLSRAAGYRTAGIHSYIDGLLRALPAALPANWQLTAFVGGLNPAHYDEIAMRRAALFGRPFDTEPPLRRIIWEQALQPWQLGGFDLHHALAFAAPLWLRQPCAVTVYDLSFIHHPGRLPAARRLYLRLLTAITCQRAKAVFAISESTARDVVTTLRIAPEKVHVIAPGTDRRVYRPLPPDAVRAFRAAQGLPERFWLFIGTLEPRKNLPTLLEAYAALPDSQRLPLILGGGRGWDCEPIFDAVARYNLGAWVRFPGFIPPADLPFWYNGAEAFIYPSVFEGFGLPVLEAMACGTPVIVSDASSLPEVAGDAGMRVKPDDVGAWTAALARAADDADWRQAARERGIERAARFTWSEAARRTAAVYRSIVG
jgi:glycosyltransferase involved in cell wall biosynthesis